MERVNSGIIAQFYAAFQQRDYTAMQALYHDDATFHDPVFQLLTSEEVRAMWQMLLTNAKDLTVTFSDIKTDDQSGTAHWEAYYTFTTTNRKVHNKINASFEFKDGKIFRHRDQFDLWRWSRMALGTSGVLLGWSPLVKNKVRRTAQGRLRKFMAERG